VASLQAGSGVFHGAIQVEPTLGRVFHPINGLGTGEREFLRDHAELLAHGIPPDVTGYTFDGVGGTEHIVVVAFFPETVTTGLLECEGSVLLEYANEFAEVGVRLDALSENMEMVRHNAEGVEKKRIFRGGLLYELQDILGNTRGAKVGASLIAADGNEIGAAAEVVAVRKAGVLTEVRHPRRLSITAIIY
jgi:hypothetical protein